MHRWSSALVAILLLGVFGQAAYADRAQPVVRAVLFWSESCPHCHEVIDNVLPPLQAQYERQLDVQMIEISDGSNYEYFQRVEDQFQVPSNMRGVPALFLGERLLIGSDQIASELPDLIAQHLSAGGLDYPDLPELEKHLPQNVEGGEICSSVEESCTDATDAAKLDSDPLGAVQLTDSGAGTQAVESRPGQELANDGFALAIIILAGMGIALVAVLVVSLRAEQISVSPVALRWSDRLIPILSLAGLVVATYLAYVETRQVAAVCGPVGDCNAVQASPYATLFGFLPVGVLGAVGYVGILLAWITGRVGKGRLAELAPLALFGMALFGVLFSMYLTYLEPFVIRAVCAWCLSQAVIITLIMLLSLNPTLKALRGE